MVKHATKRVNRIIAVALSVALLSTATVGFYPQATAEGTVPDVSNWQYSVVEDFESLAAGTAYANWGSYAKNVVDEGKDGVGAGNSRGLYVHTSGAQNGSVYGQPFYYINKAADFTGAQEIWIWYDYTKYQNPTDLKIRPRMTLDDVQNDPTMISGAPVYFQTDSGFRASTLTDADAATPDAECALRAADLTGFKGYIRLPLSSFRSSVSNEPITSGVISNFTGGYWIFDFSFAVDDNENYVENGFVMDNILLAGPTITDGKPVSGLLSGSASDQTAADAVIKLISDLPAAADLTISNKDAVAAARTAYDALSDGAKALVTNYSDLTAAEAKIAELSVSTEAKAAADAATAKITALPAAADIALTDKDAVTAARTAYDAVPEEARFLVKNLTKLTDAEAQIKALEEASAADKDAADAVTKMISDLPATIVPTSGDAVKAARAAYDKLTDAQKALVTNYSVLTDAESKIAKFENRSKDDPDPTWTYLPLADFENLADGYDFTSEKGDPTDTAKDHFKYMYQPTDNRAKQFKSVIAMNGFKGSKALNVTGIAGGTKGGYAQPLLLASALNDNNYLDYTGAEEFVMYVDFTGITMDTVGMQIRILENNGTDDKGNAKMTQWAIKEGGYAYLQVNGVWTPFTNSDYGEDNMLGKLPAQAAGRAEVAAGDNTYPNGLTKVDGYKGMVRIPLSQLVPIADTVDANGDGKMDLKQVSQLWFVFNFPGDQETSYFAVDEFGFVGKFATAGQKGETNVLDILPLSAKIDGTTTNPTNTTSGTTATTKGATNPGTGDTTATAGIAFGALAVVSLAICMKSRKNKK